MNLRPNEILPDPNDPFAGDLLERRTFAERLVRLLSSAEGPFTLAISGRYGSGKSFFLRRCQLLLEKSQVPTVLINAWESDFSSEPLAPIITELSEKFSTKLKPADKNLKTAKALAMKVAAASVPTALKVAIDLIPGADAVEKLAEKQFEHFVEAKKSVDRLKKELARIAGQIRAVNTKTSGGQSEHSPAVVVLIDELDRCRPTYAIEVLEVLKHFFDSPGIIFVLAIDREQLISAGKAVFGIGLEGDGYLRRFIDLECQLPVPSVRNFCGNLMNATSSITDWRAHQLESNVFRLCDASGFSLRKLQQFIVRAGVSIAAASTVASPHDALFLAFLRELDREMYEDFVRGKRTSWDVLIRLRDVDPDFGYPTGDHGIPFVSLLIGVGKNQPPRPFIDLLREDYVKKNVNFSNWDWLLQFTQGYSFHYLRRLADAVDFGATFPT